MLAVGVALEVRDALLYNAPVVQGKNGEAPPPLPVVPCRVEDADALTPIDAEAVTDAVSECETALDALGEGVPATDGEVEKVELPVLLTRAVEDVVSEAVSE